MFIAFQVAFAILGFLVLLNGFLRGAWKAQIDATLSILLLAAIAAAFYALSWKAALGSIALAFLYARFLRPLAAHVAVRLMGLGGRGGNAYPGLPPAWLHSVSERLGQPYSSDPAKMMQEMTSRADNRAIAKRQLVAMALRDPRIQALGDRRPDETQLAELYRLLTIGGAGQWASGHWVAASAIAYPHTLMWALAAQSAGKPPMEIAFPLLMHFERGAPLPAL